MMIMLEATFSIYYGIYLWLLVPLGLLYVAWRTNSGEKITFVLLIVSNVVLFLSTFREIKLALLGGDYSHRLYVEIGLNLLLSAACALYLAITRRFIAALAGLMLLLTWLYVGAVNSVV